MSESKIRIPFDTSAPKGIQATAAAARSAEKDVKKYTKAVADAVKSGKGANSMQTAALNESLKRAENIKDAIEKQKKNDKLWGLEGGGLRALQRVEQRFSRIFGPGSLGDKLIHGQQIHVKDVFHAALSSEKVMATIAKSIGASPESMAKVAQYGHVALKVYEMFEDKAKFHQSQIDYQELMAIKLDKKEMTRQEATLYSERLGSWRGRFDFLFNKDAGKEALDANTAFAKMMEPMTDQVSDELKRMVEAKARTHLTYQSLKANSGGVYGSQTDQLAQEYVNKASTIYDENGKAISFQEYDRKVRYALWFAEKSKGVTLSDKERDDVRRSVSAGMKTTELAKELYATESEKLIESRKVVRTPSEEMQKKQQDEIYRMSVDDYMKRIPANPTD
jgi:hypothetical protein